MSGVRRGIVQEVGSWHPGAVTLPWSPTEKGRGLAQTQTCPVVEPGVKGLLPAPGRQLLAGRGEGPVQTRAPSPLLTPSGSSQNYSLEGRRPGDWGGG